MKSDLVAQLEFLGNSCNSSKSNMATPVQKENHNFFNNKARSASSWGGNHTCIFSITTQLAKVLHKIRRTENRFAYCYDSDSLESLVINRVICIPNREIFVIYNREISRQIGRLGSSVGCNVIFKPMEPFQGKKRLLN